MASAGLWKWSERLYKCLLGYQLSTWSTTRSTSRITQNKNQLTNIAYQLLNIFCLMVMRPIWPWPRLFLPIVATCNWILNSCNWEIPNTHADVFAKMDPRNYSNRFKTILRIFGHVFIIRIKFYRSKLEMKCRKLYAETGIRVIHLTDYLKWYIVEFVE